MQSVGISRTEVDVVDLSAITKTGLKGINGVIGVTERGEVNKPILVGSWLDYVREFGGLVEGNDFPLLCRRALDAGAKLMVSRVGHYSDITDKTKLVGTKASGSIGTTNGASFEAISIGAWANGVKITVAEALVGDTTKVDITIDMPKYPNLSQTIRGINKILTAKELASKFNLEAKYVKIQAPVTLIAGTVTLAGGLQNTSLIVDADYIGNDKSSTGIHSFDDVSNIAKICVLGKAVPAIDIALANYVDKRGDLIALLRTPVGVDGDTAIDYREGSGVYSHTAINTGIAFMFTGDLKIAHPDTGVKKEISALGDILGLMSTRDNSTNEWFSFSGAKRGRINNALGVVHNLGSNARRGSADKVDARGLNMVINHPSFGVVSWGNSTLLKSDTLLKNANVAELYIFLVRGLKPLIESELFDPNDIDTWKNIHRKVTPLLEYIKNNRGIFDYLYQGDQDIDKIEDATINTINNIDQGLYVFNLFVKPKVAMKYLGVNVSVSRSGASFDILSDSV